MHIYEPTASPCVRICHLVGDICVGCRRSIEQIREWGKMSEEQKAQILETLNKNHD